MTSLHSQWTYKILSTLGLLLHLFFIDIPNDFFRCLFRRRKGVANQVVVITGAGSGLGRRLAYLFAVERKARVALLDVNEEGLKECMKEIEKEEGIARYWKVDTTDYTLLDTVASEIQMELGVVDIIVCNAAVLYLGKFEELNENELQKAMDVNVLGTVHTIRAFLPSMKEHNKGHIVTVSSIAGFAGESYGLAYCPTKFAVRGVMECLEMELRDDGYDSIVCTTICPYFARTPMILNTGMRPTSTWIPFMSINSCARQMMTAILEERNIAFIPRLVSLIALSKSIAPQSTLHSLRHYLNCRYISSSSSSSNMSDYFKSVHLIWWFIIPPALLINLLAFVYPDSLRVLPLVGNSLADFSTSHPQIVKGTNIFAVVAHIAEGLVALGLSVSQGNAFDTSFKWFIQTLIFGFPSLSILVARGNKKGKKN